jgi:hypothetical protein
VSWADEVLSTAVVPSSQTCSAALFLSSAGGLRSGTPLDAASLVMHRAFPVLGTYSQIGLVQRDLLKVRFSPDSGHVADIPACPLGADFVAEVG